MKSESIFVFDDTITVILVNIIISIKLIEVYKMLFHLPTQNYFVDVIKKTLLINNMSFLLSVPHLRLNDYLF